MLLIKNISLKGKLSDILPSMQYLSTYTREQIMECVREGATPGDEILITVSEQEATDCLNNVPQIVPVPSRSRDLTHYVAMYGGLAVSCTCESFVYGKTSRCSHMQSVERLLG